MKLYRVAYRVEGGMSGGFSWHTSRRDAETVARQAALEEPEEYAGKPPEVMPVEFKPTREGIRKLLERVATEPQNG